MLEIILDKIFLHAFSVSYDSENEYYNDFKEFLHKIRNYRLITNYKSVEEMRSDKQVLIDILINQFLPESLVFSDIDKYIDTEIINGLNKTYPFKLFLIEKDYSCLRADYGFEFLNSKNIPERWKIYYSKREDRKRKVTNDPQIPDNFKFDSWNKIKSFECPFNSIIIFDLYILGNKDGQKLRDNLFSLLKNLLFNKTLKTELQITIISEKFKEKIETLHSLISEFIESIPGISNFKLNIIRHDKRFYPRVFQDLKFRRIYTNYLIISAEKGFNCFKQKGKTAAIQNIEFSFMTEPFNNITINTELELIRTYINKVQNRQPSPFLEEEINFHKDKSNHLLN